MKAIVSEPSIGYKTNSWHDVVYEGDHYVPPLDFEKGAGLYSAIHARSKMRVQRSRSERVRKRTGLSSLVGKLSKGSGKEMMQQVKDLRKEWERDI